MLTKLIRMKDDRAQFIYLRIDLMKILLVVNILRSVKYIIFNYILYETA